MSVTRPVVFLDRDGTLNVEAGYIREVDNLKLITGAGQSVARLNKAGIAAVLVTNQTGAARGYYEEEHILALNQRLVELLAKESAYLDKIYYCPHLENSKVEKFSLACHCRKPEPGLVEKAYAELEDLDPKRAFVVGDKATDVELARNIGAKGILVRTGYGEKVLVGSYQWPVEPDWQAADIVEAVDWIIAQLSASQPGNLELSTPHLESGSQ